jgi:type II secretory pathway component GspD/PulD (secretin)
MRNILPYPSLVLGSDSINIEEATQLAISQDIPLDTSSNSGLMDKYTVNRFIMQFTEDYSCNPAHCLLVLTCLFQKGASAKSCNPEESIIVAGKKYTVKQIRSTLNKIGQRNRARRLARSLAKEILTIAVAKNIPGNLAIPIGRKYEIRTEDRPYLSDFYPEELIGINRKRMIDEHLQSKKRKKS